MEQADADAVRGRIKRTLDYADLADCDLVIEAITEDLDLKLEMWKELDGIVKAGGAVRHQHLLAAGRSTRRPPPSGPSGSWACTSSTRPR